MYDLQVVTKYFQNTVKFCPCSYSVHQQAIQTSYSLNHYFVHDYSSTLDQHHIVSILTLLAHKRFSTKILLQLLQSFLYDMDKLSHTNFSTVCVKQTFTLFTLTCPAVFSFTTMIVHIGCMGSYLTTDFFD